MNRKDPEDIFRLYIREWVIVHTLHAKVDEVKRLYDEAVNWVEEHLAGRIQDDDIRYAMHSDEAGTFWCHIEVFKDNLKGEYKQFGAAETIAHINNYEEYTIVIRNSSADHDIRKYGVTKL